VGCTTQRPAFYKATQELRQSSSRVRPKDTTTQWVDDVSDSKAIMAIEIGSDESSEGDNDSEAEEQPSQDPVQQKADEEDLYENEDAPIRLPRNPADPLPEEREKHWKTHLPYRSWCPVCVKARGREDQHRARKTKDEDGITEVAMDYCSVGDMRLLVGRENKSGHIFSHLVQCKGIQDNRVVHKVMRSISDTGNTTIALKTDGEPAIVQLQEKIVNEREQPTIPKNPPAYDPQSNGVAERAVQEVKCQLRATKLGLEARIQREVAKTEAILEWMIPHAADTVNRFLLGMDGRTAYYRVHLKNFSGKTFEFGEQVLAKPKRSNKALKKAGALEAKFHDATWVGYNARSNEHVVILQKGGPAIKVRTVKPKMQGDRWCADAIAEIAATPDAPNPHDDSQRDLRSERHTRGLDFSARGGHKLPEQRAQHEPGLKRNFRIGERLLEKFGPSVGRKACDAKIQGTETRAAHSDECRARMEQAMREDEIEKDIISKRDARQHGANAGPYGPNGPNGPNECDPQQPPHDVSMPSDPPQPEEQQAARPETASPAVSFEAKRKAEETAEVMHKKQRLNALMLQLLEATDARPATPAERAGPGRHAPGSKEIKEMHKIIGQVVDAHPHDEAEDCLYDPYEFFDDVSGKLLNKDLATAARKLEMKFFKDMQVYEKVDRRRAAADGCRVISTKWLDVNKGDATNPNYRARLVGREIKMDSRLDLFAATPPLESLRLMCSMCASNQARADPFRVMAIDVRRAYFYAKVTRPVYIEIPIEDYEHGDEGRVAKLNLSLYGTRDAAQNWAKEYTQHLVSCGFVQGLASPCSFRHERRELMLTVHGDDFTVTGPTSALQWFKGKMQTRYEIKTNVLGPDAGMQREIQVLNRTLGWGKSGITYEADQRHAEIIIQELCLKTGNAVVTPSVPEASDEANKRLNSPELTLSDSTRYRALAARINYLSLDRPDLQYAAKCVSKYMSAPREHDWTYIKRLARYLVGATRAVQTFKWQSPQKMVRTYVDSDWAGDKISRKSTSGGAMCIGKHMIKSWSTTQQTIAMSSGEAELYAMVKGAAQTKGLISMINDYGFRFDACVCSDASAAIGIVHRQGLGKTRHIQVQYLWMQAEVADGRMKVQKVRTDDNPADLMTKSLSNETMSRHLHDLSFCVDTTRAKSAARLQSVPFLSNKLMSLASTSHFPIFTI